MRLSEIGRPQIKEFRNGLFSNGYAGATINHDTERLLSLESLTPGDIRAVHRSATIVPDGNATHARIIEQLSEELVFRKSAGEKKIGF